MKIVGRIRAHKPDVPILTTESASCVSSRGCYFFPVTWQKSSGFRGFHASSYELYAPQWANRPDLDFALLEKNPAVAGEFVWTGFDYLGEPTPFNADSANALNFDNETERGKAMARFRKLGGSSPSRSSYPAFLTLKERRSAKSIDSPKCSTPGERCRRPGPIIRHHYHRRFQGSSRPTRR